MLDINIMEWFGSEDTIDSRYSMIKSAGFSGIQMGQFLEPNYEARCGIAKKYSLKIENLHVPFRNVNSLWEPGIDGDNYTNLLINCAEFCEKNEIPAVVIHLSNGLNPPEKIMLGWSRLERAICKAYEFGVRFLVENLHFIDNGIKIFFDIFAEYHVGFCFDTGHAHCYTPEYNWLEHFGDKLAALHISDNDGKTDTHALPFDGTNNWDSLVSILNKNKSIPLSFEVRIDRYKNYYKNDFNFLKDAYEKARQLEKLLSKQEGDI